MITLRIKIHKKQLRTLKVSRKSPNDFIAVYFFYSLEMHNIKYCKNKEFPILTRKAYFKPTYQIYCGMLFNENYLCLSNQTKYLQSVFIFSSIPISSNKKCLLESGVLKLQK